MTSSKTSAASRFLEFVDASPTPYHAVAAAKARLEAAGFTKLRERDAWKLEPGSKHYFTRNQSSLCAFVLPPTFKSGDGVAMIATHVDSCCLKVRPVSKKEKNGYLQVACELYGGGIWRTWFDRDLSLAGRVVVETSPDTFVSKLVKVDRPLLRIPSLAIHLDRGSNDEFKFNKETQFTPVLGLISAQLNGPSKELDGGASSSSAAVGMPQMENKHHAGMLDVIAKELGCDAGQIQDFDLCLYDTQPATIGGLSEELIFAPRMDNLMSSFAAVEGLTRSTASLEASTSSAAQAILLFDNEEIGSVSYQGAESSMLPDLVSRLTAARVGLDKEAPTASSEEVFAKSFMLSADMGHGVHPNFSEKHQDLHQPMLGSGVVIKTNANQRYASTGLTTFLLRRVAKVAGVPLQEFEVRNDSACGSTVGPHLSTHVRTVDVGLAQWAMHSIRETAATKDVPYYIDFMRSFLQHFGKLDLELTSD